MHILILGGGLEGLASAAQFRALGHEVTIALPSTYLGEELCGTFRFLPALQQESGLAQMNTALSRMTQPAYEGPLLWGRAKRTLLEAVLATSCRLLYMTRLAGVEVDNGRICAAHLASKHGLSRLACDAIVDATPYGEPSHQLAEKQPLVRKGTSISTMLEYRGIEGLLASQRVPQGELLVGIVAPDHAFLRIDASVHEDMSIPQARRLITLESFQAAQAFHQQFPQAALQQVLAPYADIRVETAPRPPVSGWFRAAEGDFSPGLVASLGPAPERGEVRLLHAPITQRKTQLAVAGGGTAGVWAAISAAREGMEVSVLELFAHLGGTRTVGGIFPLYGGNRNQLFNAMWAEIMEAQRSVGGRAGEPLLYAQLFEDLGIRLHAPCILYGAEKEGTRLTRIHGVDEDGVFSLLPEHTIDATGDGDLAAFAGVPFDFGDAEAGFTQNYSQSHRYSGTGYDKGMADQDVMDQTLQSEWTRAITFNTLQCADYDIVEMLTVREGRRIQGRERVRMRDIVRGRRMPDAIYDALCDYDPHGRCFSEIGRLGVLPQHAPHRFACVPYGALLPRHLDNLFVVGKAISADQDGFNFIRMCPDIMCIAWIAGYAAAKAYREGSTLPEVNLTALRIHLHSQGALLQPPDGEEHIANPASSLLPRLLVGQEAAFAEAVLADWQEELPGLLEDALAIQADSKPLLPRKVLMHYGHKQGLQLMLDTLEALNRSIGDAALSDYETGAVALGGITDRLTDGWHANQLAVLLARAQCRQAIPAILQMFEHTTQLGESGMKYANAYHKQRIDHHTCGNFDRMLCLAYAARKMPDRQFGPHLMRLHGLLGNHATDDSNFYNAWLGCTLAIAAMACEALEGRALMTAYGQSKYASLRRLSQRVLGVTSK